ncbi:MAG: nucleotidyltransferase family protein [Chloroflexia bacterium]|nr:nucleotidyltransferase family protein [Chloroflexia bacterium]
MSLWEAVDYLIDRAEEPGDLEAHGLQVLAARRWRATGRLVPPEFLAAEQMSAMVALAIPVELARVRSILAAPIVVLKGPEIAARYPDSVLRPVGDLDLLVPDADSAQRGLLAAGYELNDALEYRSLHHQPALRWPGSPLPIELHCTLNAPAWVAVPPVSNLITAAVKSATGIAGILALSPQDHALAVSAHAWKHGPFSRFLDLLDVAVLSEGMDRASLAAHAQRWHMHRLWSATIAATDALSSGQSVPWWTRQVWARHLGAPRERTVSEAYLMRWLSGCWASSLSEVPGAVGWFIWRDVRPREGEHWLTKLARIVDTSRYALRPLSARRDHG